jgi:uncharacterized protein (DUF3084 family)
MVDEDKTNTQSGEEKPSEKTNVAAPKNAQETPDIDLEALRREIEEADKKLVSEDVSKLIKQERELAKKEAEKEYLINQRLQEKEAEIAKMKEASVEEQKKNAEQLAYLKSKLDELVASKQVVNNDNPFRNDKVAPQIADPIAHMTDKDLDELERASFQAMLDKRNN